MRPLGADARRWGFEWGPMSVTRTSHIEGRGYSLDVETDHAKVTVYVTEAGRSIRVFRGGKELT